MKLGNMEGTPTEISNIIENNGMQLADVLQLPEEPLPKIWLLAPAVLFALSCTLLVMLNPLQKAYWLLLFLVAAGSTAWLAIGVQIRFKNAIATFVVGVSGLLLLLIAVGLVEPKDSIDVIRSMKGPKSE